MSAPPVERGRLDRAGLALLAFISLIPLIYEPTPVNFLPLYGSTIAKLAGQTIVILAMGLAIFLSLRADVPRERHAYLRGAGFCVAAATLTAVHYVVVECRQWAFRWQQGMYLGVLNHLTESPGASFIPHAFRPLPYGFTRALERVTHDWEFACVAYRWFFTYWFLDASYRFSRRFLPPNRALASVLPYLALYPLSVWYYNGQLTDPLSHALFALSLIYLVDNKLGSLAAALALGVAAKETALLLVPAYASANVYDGWKATKRTLLLAVVGTAAFLAVRVPLGWRPEYRDLNGVSGLMVRDNLGLSSNYGGYAPLYQNYLQPVLFVGVFLPFIMIHWRRIDSRLRGAFLVLIPLILGTSLCFGWLYESRNYVPLLPLLATMALAPGRQVPQKLP